MLLDPHAQGSAPVGHPFGRSDLLRWLYLGRLALVTGILAGALLRWFRIDQQATLLAVIMFLVGLGVTSLSFWYSHLLQREPGENFLYAQVILDTLLVTGIVHITQGPESSFAPLYILVISSGALLLPLPGGVLIGGLASVVYSADMVWGFEGTLAVNSGLQIGLFTIVALITGLLGDRLRRAGLALGEVESELRQLRLDTGDILANLATGVLTVDGQGRLMYANGAAESLLGMNVEEWRGREVVAEVDRVAPGLGRVLRRSIESGQGVERFTSIAQRDGGARHLGISTAVLERGAGVPPSATAIFQDITDLERIEALNRRAERLEAVAELSASLAHEIRNPLASIRSAVEQLTRSSLDTEDRGTLERLVVSESDRLSRLLSEFLDYSAVRLGASQTVDLPGLIRNCVELARQNPDSEGVDILCEGVDQPLAIPGDPDLLHRALFNLLVNAIHFSRPHGTVEVTLDDLANRPNPRGTTLGRVAAITVRDTGPGVDPDVLPRIFDPFFTTRERGNGLGLAVVYRAVEAHGGAIFVDDARGGGAAFVIYLPRSGPDGGNAS